MYVCMYVCICIRILTIKFVIFINKVCLISLIEHTYPS